MAAYAVDVYLLFCILFPVQFEVGESSLPEAAELLPCAVFQHKIECLNEAVDAALVPEEAALEAMRFVQSLLGSSVWSKQLAFMEAASTCGTFARCPVDKRAVQSIVEDWSRSVWFIHQETELSHSPVFHLASDQHVIARDLMPVFCDRPSWPEENRRRQRGSVLGLTMFGAIQVFTLLNAAASIPSTRVNYVQNMGGVTLRPSSNILKQEMSGGKNHATSTKSTSPVQAEHDSEAFGTEAAKIRGAQKQTDAFRRNNRLLTHVTRHIDRPSPTRLRGWASFVTANTKSLSAFSASGHVSSEESAGLEAVLRAAREGAE